MKESKPFMNRPLREVLVLCHEVATSHGIPLEVAVVMLLCLSSATAGHLVDFKADDGLLRNARLSLVLTTGDVEVPVHFKAEMEELFRRQAEVVGKPTSPLEDAKVAAALRREGRVLSKFGTPGFKLKMIEALIGFNKRRKSLGAFTRLAKTPSSLSKPAHTTVIVESAAALKKLLTSADRQDGWWQALTAEKNGLELLACLPERQWHRLALQPDADKLLGRAWTIPCPASSFDPENSITPKLLCGGAFNRLEYARFGSTRFQFIPSAEPKELLNHSVEQFRAMEIELRSLNGYDVPFPDPYLAWKFSGVLTALCCDVSRDELDAVFVQCTRLGCALASWVLRQHVGRLRSSFPQLQGQALTRLDQRVFRALTPVPAPARTIQRRLKRVRKVACVASLGLLVDAKLAMETRPGHFATFEESDYCHELSTFLSTFDLNHIFPLRPEPQATDSTDKPARTEKREISPHH